MADDVTVTLDDSSLGALLFGKGRRKKQLLGAIGVEMQNASRKRFETQEGPDGGRWPERSVPNIPGVIRDLERGPHIQPKRFDGRPALIDTGALRNSIQYEIKDNDTVAVKSTSAYAELHQQGGEYRIPVLPVARENLRLLLKAHKNASQASLIKRHEHPLRMLLVASEVTGEVPPRPFLGPPREMDSLTQRMLSKQIEKNVKEEAGK